MTKQAKLYCEAMNAEYKNKCLYKLIKYKKALNNIPEGFDRSSASHQSLFLARETLNKEINHKKEKYWSFIKPLLITIIGGIVAGFVLFFFSRHYNTNIHHQQYPQQQQGLHK
ncbi:MAG: hypothetical protein ACE5KZ_16265 [Candidatus Scalinduaceae bacterium]